MRDLGTSFRSTQRAGTGVTRAYRHEWLLLGLIALTALTFYHDAGAQDTSRLALTQAVYADHSLRVDLWGRGSSDITIYDGHYYSDKAPGMSFLALPAYALLRGSGLVSAGDERAGVWQKRSALFILRLVTGGIAFLIAVFLVGRVAEALAEGTGAASATAFGLGTLMLPLAGTMFGHVTAATLAFAGFVTAWSGLRACSNLRMLVAGLLTGAAFIVEYQSAVIALVVLVYVLTRSAPSAVPFFGGALVSVAALGAYNSAAFDSPFHFSYGYVREEFADLQDAGLFGIGVPNADSMQIALFSSKGLLVQSPVLVLAAAGLVLAWRAGLRAEAVACGAVAAVLVMISAGYFDPMGGLSPGARFMVPALPFLTVGLPLTFRRWPVATLVTMEISVVAMFYRAGVWSHVDVREFDNVWGILGSNALRDTLGEDTDGRLATGLGVVLMAACALGAMAVSASSVLAARRAAEPPSSAAAGSPISG